MIVQGVVKPAPGLDFASKPDVRYGSFAPFWLCLDVRFAPNNDRMADIRKRSKRAISDMDGCALKSSPISVGLFPPKWLCGLMRSVVTRNTEIA